MSAFTVAGLLAAAILLVYSTVAVCRLRGDRRGPTEDAIEATRFSFGAATLVMAFATVWDLATGEKSYQSVRDWWGIAVMFVCIHATLVIHILRGGKKAGNHRKAQTQGAAM